MPIPYLNKKHAKKTVASAENIRKKRADARKKESATNTDKTSEKKALASHGRVYRFIHWFTWKRTAWIVGGTSIFCIFSGAVIAAGLYMWVSKDLADVADVEKRAIKQSAKIYARDGQTLLYEFGDNKRQDVTLDKIDDQIEHATLALEDKNFYKHHGINFISLARAAISNALNLKTGQGGASTLTQQFISNVILKKSDRSYTRKIKEAILAFRLERKYSKAEILNMYMNEIYYGRNYQGVEVSAQKFFKKSAEDVTLAEAATLAALPNNPPYYLNNPDRLLSRRNRAIDAMVEEGYATTEEAEAAKAEELSIQDNEATDIRAPHFVFYVQQKLFEEYGDRINKDGFNVVTTLDWDKQQKAEEAIRNGIANVEKYNGDNAALVTIDTKTGQILAMVGSRDYFDRDHSGQYNVATGYNRQPGSSFKPIVYYTAFSKGFIPETKVIDTVTTFPQAGTSPYIPLNFNGAKDQRGPVTLRYALNQSLNIPAVKMMYLVGKDTVLDVADALGYTSLKDRESFGSGLALSLGAGNVSLLEHTSAYATFSREGERHPPEGILSVKDRSGNTIYEWQDSPQQVLNKDAARTLNNVLSDSAARGSVFSGLNLKGRQVAAKTGTSNDFKDAWAMGYTPSIATGVWAGRNDNQPMNYLGDGIVIAAPIFKAYMDSILDGSPSETFQSPSYRAANDIIGGNLEKTVSKSVDSVTGQIIPDECLTTYPAAYVVQKDFKELHTILHYIDRNNPTGKTPEDPTKDPMYNSWEKAVEEWVKKNKASEYLNEDTPKIACDFRDPASQPKVSITSMNNGEFYSKPEFRIRGTVTPGNGRTITTIHYIIDNITVETVTGQSINSTTDVSSSYRPKTLTVGKHGVTIKVIDDRGNVATNVINVRYTGEVSEETNTNTITNVNTNSSTTNQNTNSSTQTNTNTNS